MGTPLDHVAQLFKQAGARITLVLIPIAWIGRGAYGCSCARAAYKLVLGVAATSLSATEGKIKMRRKYLYSTLTILAAILVGCTLALAFRAPRPGNPQMDESAMSSAPFVPYHAAYRRTEYRTNKSGGSQTVVTYSEMFRSEDATLLTQETDKDGTPLRGMLFQGEQPIRLDYKTRSAVYLPTDPHRQGHKHFYPIPDAPLGSLVIAGHTFTAYPIHGLDGGTAWVDTANEVIGRVDASFTTNDGIVVRAITEATLVDIGTVDESVLKVPANYLHTKGGEDK